MKNSNLVHEERCASPNPPKQDPKNLFMDDLVERVDEKRRKDFDQ